jgi:indolepyruvate ferredoxin oxidoreductase
MPLVEAETRACGHPGAVSAAAARSLFKLMSYKDEYEVARLYSDGSFRRQLAKQFESYERLEYHMAPPVLGRKNSQGHPVKTSFGRGMGAFFSILARLKVLRGTPFDPFGYTVERKMERELLSGFVSDLDFVKNRLLEKNANLAVEFLSYPMKIRGYGHVKESSAERYLEERQQMKRSMIGFQESASGIAAE